MICFFYRITIDKYERNTLLTIRRAVRIDSGKYTLILKNSSGTAEKSAEVIVLGIYPLNLNIKYIHLYLKTSIVHMILDKPLHPMGPVKIEEVRANHVKISWKKPQDNGGSEITGYIIEKMDMDSGRWVAAGEVKSQY